MSDYLPLHQAQPSVFRGVQLLATDMDGTVTCQDKFTTAFLQALEALAQANFPVILTTGRSAGWVSGLWHYLPITGAIAENGGIFYGSSVQGGEFLTPLPDLTQHRQHLAEMFHLLQAEFPSLQESLDNSFRLTDWTFDVQGLTPEALETLAQRCTQAGWGFTYSTVQCHIKPASQNKGEGLQTVLQRHFPHLSPRTVVTVGDSPNDEDLFVRDRFPLSIGVANLRHYQHTLQHHPTYITSASEGAGFCELVEFLLRSHAQEKSVDPIHSR